MQSDEFLEKRFVVINIFLPFLRPRRSKGKNIREASGEHGGKKNNKKPPLNKKRKRVRKLKNKGKKQS